MSNTLFLSFFFFFYFLRNLNFNFTCILMGKDEIIVLFYQFHLLPSKTKKQRIQNIQTVHLGFKSKRLSPLNYIVR